MNFELRPATLQTLASFQQRRQKLLRIRAGISALTVVAGGLLLIALLDRARLMPESARPWLSLLTYAGAAAVAWMVALRYLAAGRDAESSAELLEAAAPAVREKVLAAVELSHGEARDSEEFRAVLQDQVAGELGKLDVNHLLPLSALRVWFVRGGAVAALTLMLAFVSSLHLPGFLARAAIPFANFARPSSVRISIVEPHPPSMLTPMASEKGIVAAITGHGKASAILETQAAGGRIVRHDLRQAGADRFEGAVAVGQSDVRYRIAAGDAVTAWHTLGARARPRIIEFAKTITPPAYTGLPPKTVTEEYGDLEALEGSVVAMTLKTNQPVAQGRLLLNPDQPDPFLPQPLPAKGGSDQLQAEVTIKPELATWQVGLTAAETGFTNEESSPWQITSIADLPPMASITEPETQIELLADESVRLSGTAGDDVGLASVKLVHAINGSARQEIELASRPPGTEVTVQHVLPLAPLQVKPGDTVILKLAATDLKGQTTESLPVRVLILEQTIDPKQRQWAADLRRLAQESLALSGEARELNKVLQQVQKGQKRKNAAEKDQSRAEDALARAETGLEQVTARADDLWKNLNEAARNAPTQLDASEARLLGERLSQMRRENLPGMRRGIETDNVEMLRREGSSVAAQADLLANSSRTFAAEENARILALSAQHLQRQQSLMTENALPANRDAAQRPQWQEQQRAAIAATNGTRRELEMLKSAVDAGSQRQLDDMGKQIADAATDLAESLDKPGQAKSPEHLYGATDNLRQRLARTAATANTIAENAANQAAAIRDRLQRQVSPSMAALEAARGAMANALAESRDKKQKPPKIDKDGSTFLERAEAELGEAAKQFEDQAALREQTPDTNDQAALDANRASRALDQLAREVKALPRQQGPEAVTAAQQKVEQLVGAVRALAIDAQVQTATKAGTEAAARPDPARAAIPTKAADDSRAAAEAMRQLPDALRRLKTPEATQLASTAQQAVDGTRHAAEMLQSLARQNAQQPTAPLANLEPARTAAADAVQKTEEIAQQLQTQGDNARSTLAQMTPEVSDMMRAVAADLKETQQQTQMAATDAEAGKPVDEVATKAQALQPLAAANAEKLESLQAALRQEANAADLADAQARQMARTADVALSQVQKKTPQISQNLKQAAQATQSQPQAQALQNAAAAQQQTAQALDQLAQNLAALEQGQPIPEQDAAAMAQMEQELGVQQALDEAYARAQALAQMAQNATENPAAVLAELEKELGQNPAMKKSLAEISKQAAQDSESAVAVEANQPSNVGLATEKAAHDLARVSRHQQRVGQNEAANQTATASRELRQTAQTAKGMAPDQPQQPVGTQAQATAAAAAKTAEAAAAATPSAVSPSPFHQIQSTMLAGALDSLDQLMNPQMGPPGESPPQPGGSQQQAQQNLAGAQQQQQQQMASQRNQGQTPGSNQQTAQNSPKPPSQSQPASTPTADGNMQAQLVAGDLGAPIILVDGDWGHLPSKIAEGLTEATRAEAAPEYRAAIENYYKAIANRAKR